MSNSRKKMKLKVGDQVRVIAGRDKGQTGKILRTFPETSKVIVEGVQVGKRHVKPSATAPNGGIVEKNLPIHVSNVMILDPETQKTTRIGRRKEGETLVRFAKRSGKLIPAPAPVEMK